MVQGRQMGVQGAGCVAVCGVQAGAIGVSRKHTAHTRTRPLHTKGVNFEDF